MEYKIVETENEWNDIISKFDVEDINFDYNYFNLYTQEGERPVLVYMEDKLGKVAYPFMLRDIAFHECLRDRIEKNEFFDISSPFGYSGPLIKAYDEQDKKALIELFYSEFGSFCTDHKIVSEFIKFSPILKTYKNMDSVIETIYLKKMLATNLKSKESIEVDITRGRRKSIKKTRSFGLKTEFIISPKSLDIQRKIYYDTMDRKQATEAFLFSKSYFDKMLSTLSENILLVNTKFEGKIIGFGLRFLSGDIIYGHISGTLREYLKYSPSNITYEDTINWGYENYYKYFFTGGGLTNSEEDSLYLFKRTFAKHTDFDFYIGKKVWNQKNYDYLLSVSSEKARKNKNFFPQYREY